MVTGRRVAYLEDTYVVQKTHAETKTVGRVIHYIGKLYGTSQVGGGIIPVYGTRLRYCLHADVLVMDVLWRPVKTAQKMLREFRERCGRNEGLKRGHDVIDGGQR